MDVHDGIPGPDPTRTSEPQGSFTPSGHAASTHYYDVGTDYATVWLGVNFHNGVSLQSDRDTLMNNIINFFDTVPVELQSFSVE